MQPTSIIRVITCRNDLTLKIIRVIKLTAIFLCTVCLHIYANPESGGTVPLARNKLPAILKPTRAIIKGVVKDEKGAPLSNVSVSLRGTKKGTATNANGEFSIEANAGDVLDISMIGYKKASVTIGNDTNITIQLEPDITESKEVVVVGYGTQKKANLIGAISTVDAKMLESRPLTNVGQGLQGLIPNLNISTGNGRPGTGASFNVRGYTSINGGSPLILVDGVQMDPNQINPDDVESVTVLKDAASAAIYGGRAAYGVILITTKKGKRNSPLRVNYAYDYTITRPTRLPKPLNSVDYITMYMDADKTGTLTGGTAGAANFNATDLEKAKAYIANPIPVNSVYRDPNNPSKYRYVSNTDWIKLQFPGWVPQQQHNLSLSGGGENTSYRGSFGLFNQKGTFKEAKQDFKRYNINLSLNSKVTSWIDVNAKMTLNRQENDQPARSALFDIPAERIATDLSPLLPVRHPDGHFTSNSFNPFAAIESGGRYKFNSDDIWLTGGFTLNPVKNVKIVGDYTWNSYRFNDKNNTVPYDAYGPPPPGEDITDPTKAVLLGKYGLSVPARVSESSSTDRYIAANIYAQYENTLAEKHYLKAMIGYNQEKKHYESFNASVKDLLNPEYPYIRLNNDPKPNVGSGASEWALAGTFFRLNYIFDQRYLLEVNGRYDGSSRFQRDSRYVFSPSVLAGWRVSSEKFFTPVEKVLNYLMLRVSYGQLPNQLLGTNYYPSIAVMPSGTTNYIFGGAQQSYVSAPGLISQNFTWETVSTRNAGIDFGFLGNRLTGKFDYYIRDTKDMIVDGAALPVILGTAPPVRNAADLRTKGFELELNWSERLPNGLSYSIGFNLADNKAKITKYDLNAVGNINNHYVGKEIGEIWGYETVGLYQTDADAAAVNNTKIWGGKWLAGDVHYADLNKDGEISPGNSTLADPGDQKIIGNNQPRFMYGITAGVGYKGFDFSMLAQGVAKRDVMLEGAYFWGFTQTWAVPTAPHLDYWRPDNTGAYFPRPRFEGGGNFKPQTRYLQSGAYLRMKQLTLGYTLPEYLLQKIKLNRLRAYITGQNLFEITKMLKSFDPEQTEDTEQTDDRTAYPLIRSVSFGVQISL